MIDELHDGYIKAVTGKANYDDIIEFLRTLYTLERELYIIKATASNNSSATI